MNRLVFVALMTSWALAAPASSPGLFWSPRPAVREPELVARVVLTPAATWTCAHNGYRSVACQ